MRRALPFLALGAFATLADAQPTPTGVVDGTVTILKSGGSRAHSAEVWVYLDDVPGQPRLPKKNPKITQRTLTFQPRVTVVVQGTTIDFPNQDTTFHNVFSPTAYSQFNLGKYKAGASKSQTFDELGEIDIFCNIHPDMSAKVKVVPNNYYVHTDSEGRFHLGDVPPGTYRIHAWLPDSKESVRTITVKEGKICDPPVTLEIKEGKAPRSHPREDGTPYDRYQ